MNSVTLFTLLITFLKIGSAMFGGGYAMIPILKHEIVDRNRWLSEEEFMDLIAIAESTPGPVAVNAATYVGYKLGGVLGAVIATIAVVAPAFTVILALAAALAKFYHHIIVKGILFGIRAAVVGLIAAALTIVVRGVFRELNALQTAAVMVIAVAVFISVTKLGVDPVILILLSAALGLALGLAGFI